MADSVPKADEEVKNGLKNMNDASKDLKKSAPSKSAEAANTDHRESPTPQKTALHASRPKRHETDVPQSRTIRQRGEGGRTLMPASQSDEAAEEPFQGLWKKVWK